MFARLRTMGFEQGRDGPAFLVPDRAKMGREASTVVASAEVTWACGYGRKSTVCASFAKVVPAL